MTHDDAVTSGDENTRSEVSESLTSCGPSDYVLSWLPILYLKRVFESTSSLYADLAHLTTSFYPADTNAATITESRNPLTADSAAKFALHFRLGVPTLCSEKILVATPSSLIIAFSVALEVCRRLVQTNRCDTRTNMSKETLGVLENWVDFFTYGTLLPGQTDRHCIDDQVWVRTNTPTDNIRATCAPSPISIVIATDDSLPEMSSVSPELQRLNDVWKATIDNRIAERFAILVHENEITPILVKRIMAFCVERLTF